MRRFVVILAALAVTCSVPLASARISTGDITAEATSSSGAVVTFADDGSCSPSSGSTFALGTTPVTCNDGSFNVTVTDTTPPTVTVPSDIGDTSTDASGKAVTFSTSATDIVDGSVSVTCTPASGSTFPIGTTRVDCSATDAHSNEGSASFNVTITFSDTENPTLSVPGPITTEATGSSGAVVGYTVTASDNSGTVNVACSPASGATFPIGTTPVNCTATDPSSNSTPGSFNVTVQDTTAPTLSLPSNMTIAANSSSGAAVTYPATATDAVAGSVPVNCSPASGSSFPFGTTTVNCSATDGHNSASGSFTITVDDSTAPTFSNAPGTLTREANGPSGSVVTYTKPTATDDVDGPIAGVDCVPASGSTFPLGATTVTCSATDSHGNQGSSSFTVRVVDTTPPTLIAPDGWNAYATTDAGIPINEAAASAFVHGAFVSDVVDPHPTVTTNAPAVFPVGKTTVVFTARDASGNTRSATATLTVRPKPAEGTTPEPLPPPPDRIPPDDVKNLAAAAGDGAVTLTWGRPTASDFGQVQITRSLNTGGGDAVVYTGAATRFVDRGVENGVEYRYVVVAIDKSGNASAGVAVSAKPARSVLRTPKDGAVVKKPPKFVWLAFADATYYNFQLFRGTTKILSAWPKKPTIALKKSWKFDGHKYTLTPGVYRWYVWPGLGARADANYGDMLGSSTFTVSR